MNAQSDWEVVITFDGPLGQGKAVIEKVEGPACEAVAKWLRETMDVKDERKTPDYDRLARNTSSRRADTRR